MADKLVAQMEEKILKMKQKEDFAAAFAHELLTEATWRIDDGGNDIGFTFPYGGCSLDFEMRLTDREGTDGTVLIGFPELYDRIPEFTE